MKSTASQHKSSSKAETGVGMKNATSPGVEDRISRIATAAYFKAEARGFAPGRELEDWLDAEAKFNGCEEG